MWSFTQKPVEFQAKEGHCSSPRTISLEGRLLVAWAIQFLPRIIRESASDESRYNIQPARTDTDGENMIMKYTAGLFNLNTLCLNTYELTLPHKCKI